MVAVILALVVGSHSLMAIPERARQLLQEQGYAVEEVVVQPQLNRCLSIYRGRKEAHFTIKWRITGHTDQGYMCFDGGRPPHIMIDTNSQNSETNTGHFPVLYR